MNKKLCKNFLWAMCLMVAVILFQAPQAMANSTGQPSLIVTNLPDLLTAIENAEDGDVIGYDDNINIDADVTIGENEKHVTLKKMNENAHFNISGGTAIIQNVTFDGDMISSSYPLIIASANTTFQNVTFQNANAIWSNGGAVSLRGGVTNFNDCIFKDNIGGQGGHLFASEYSKVTVENSLFENGHASNGGAIKNQSYEQYGFIIRNSTITENTAVNFGGGISNNGHLEIYETKIFNNTATNGGADIANASSLIFTDTVEELVALFKDDGIVPNGWVNDYDFEAGVSIPGIDPSQPNSLLKLDYEIPPTEVILEASSLGTPGDGKITGLESGKQFMVTVDGVINYVKSDGSLTTVEAEAEALTGTEIVGLTNGMTYLVEEYTPVIEEPVTEEPVTEEPETPTDEEPTPIEENPTTEEPTDEETPAEEEPATPTEPETDEETEAPIEQENPTDDTNTPDEHGDEPEQGDNQSDGDTNPTPEEEQEPVTPSNPSTPSESESESESEQSSNESSHRPVPIVDEIKEPVIEKEPSPAIVLKRGEAVLDTTNTIYLMAYSDSLKGQEIDVTRGQVAQMVYRLLTPESVAAVYSETSRFDDVSEDAWYNVAVSTIANAGIVVGYGDGKFHPDKNITWAELVTIINRFVELQTDTHIITEHWARDSLNTAISLGWIDYNDKFNPNAAVSVSETTDFINAVFTWTAKQNEEKAGKPMELSKEQIEIYQMFDEGKVYLKYNEFKGGEPLGLTVPYGYPEGVEKYGGVIRVYQECIKQGITWQELLKYQKPEKDADV